jgi:hypothetical protein
MIWKLYHLVGTDLVVGAGDSVPARAQLASKHARRPWLVLTRDVPSKRRVVRRTLTRSGVAKALRDRKGVGVIRLRYAVNGYFKPDYNPARSIPDK